MGYKRRSAMIALCAGRSRKTAGSQQPLVDGLQLLPRFEAHGLARRDADFSASTGIASDAGFARAHIEDAKSAQFNAFTQRQGLLHALKDGFHGQLCLGFGDTGFVDNFINNVELNHWAALLKQIVRKGVTCRCYWTSTLVVNDAVWPIRWLLCRVRKIPKNPLKPERNGNQK